MWPMTKVNRANIPAELRAEFEQYGEAVVAQIMGSPYSHAAGQNIGVPMWAGTPETRQAALQWLREKHNEEERAHNITMAMELAILLLVAVEAVPILSEWARHAFSWIVS